MLFNIQVLRAIAAMLVVHAHVASFAGLDLAWTGGANGVDLFFVISGFIIAYVAALDSREFLLRRLIRIVPIYWASTLAIYALVVVAPQLFRSTSSDPVLLIRSLLFLPTGSSVHTSDGIPHPTLNGGWTLNYEMYFYVVYAVSLAISRTWATAVAIAVLVAVIAVVHATSLIESPVAAFYGNPIVFEFVFGMLAFHALRWIGDRPAVGAHTVEKLGLVAAAIGGLVVLAFNYELLGDTSARWLYSGVPGFFVLFAAVLLERRHGLRITNRLAVMTGDASYVLYLIHVYVVLGVTRLVIGHHRFSEVPGQLVDLVLIAIATTIAIGIYRYFEQPILRVLKRKLLKPSVRPAPAASAR